MRKSGTVICAIALSLSFSCVGCASRPAAFTRDVPMTLQSRIDDNLKDISRKHPLTEQQKAEVLRSVRGIDPKQEASQRSGSGSLYALKQHGIKAIPAISDMLVSPEEHVRQQAILSLEPFIDQSNSPPTEYVRVIEPTLIALLHRSLLADKSAGVRRNAVALLSVVSGSWHRRGEPPSSRSKPGGLKDAAEEGLDDADVHVREDAQLLLQRLGHRPSGPIGSKWID